MSSVVPSDLDAEDIETELEKILATESFARAERLSRFLRFVVEQALRGLAANLKEYSIALEVFDKPDSFDSRTDPIVRVEAGRLRAKITEYYASEGRNDAVFIGLRKRGYRPVFRRREPESIPASEQAATVPAEQESASDPAPPRAVEGDRTAGRSASEDYQSIAVLPFADLSPQKTQEYFCDALSQQIISSLAKMTELRVVGRTSAFQFKDKAEDIRRIAHELNVDTVLEGSVQKSGKRVRVSVQLISASNGLDLWGDIYDRPLEDVFALQDEISQAVVEGLKASLLGESGARGRKKRNRTHLEAYNQYLKGLYHWNKRTEAEMRKSIDYFEKAIQEDATYAPAYAGVAGCYVSAGISSTVPPADVMPKAKAAIAKALELDPDLAKAHAALGMVKGLYEWDWPGSREAFERALELHPRLAVAHQWRAIGYSMPQGRLEEALKRMQAARRINPVSVIINTHLGLAYYMNREFERAVGQLQLAIEMEPEFYRAHWDLGRAYALNGRPDKAIAAYERARDLSGGRFRLGALGHCYALAGRKERAEELFDEMQTLSKRQYVPPYDFAEICLGLGEDDLMFEWLNRAYEDHSPWLAWINADPIFDRVRSDQRFSDLLTRIGLGRRKSPPPEQLATSA